MGIQVCAELTSGEVSLCSLWNFDSGVCPLIRVYATVSLFTSKTENNGLAWSLLDELSPQSLQIPYQPSESRPCQCDVFHIHPENALNINANSP